MAKSKKHQYPSRKIAERLDNDTVRLIEWVDKMEKEALDDRRVVTVITKHGAVLQVR